MSYFPTLNDEVDPTNPMPPEPDPEVPIQSLLASVGTVTVGANQVFDVTLPETVTLSGTLTDDADTSLAGATVLAIAGLPVPIIGGAGGDPPPQEPPAPTEALCQAGSLTTAILDLNSASATLPKGNTMGIYEMPVVPLPEEAYQVTVTTPLALLPPAMVPPDTLEPQEGDLTFPFPPDMITITMDQVQDYVLPAVPGAVLFTGKVTYGQNQPVVKARVSARSSMLTGTPNVLFDNEVETNDMGDYQLLLLSGVDYTLTVCPPEPSPFVIPTP